MSFESFEPMDEPLEPRADRRARAALVDYRKGMRNLGRSLIALALLQLAFGGLFLVIQPEPAVAAVAIGLGLAHLVMGALILLGHWWVNIVVLVWSVLLLIGNFAAMGLNADKGADAASSAPCIGLLIAAALIYYSVQNLVALAKVRAGGLEP